jgi:hypothetical protein
VEGDQKTFKGRGFWGLIEPPVARGDVFPDLRCRLAGKSFVLALPP